MSIEHQLRRINKSTAVVPDPYWTSVSTLLLTNSVAPASVRLGITDLTGTVTTTFMGSNTNGGPAFSLRSPFAGKKGSYYSDGTSGSTAVKLGPQDATSATYPTLNYSGDFTVECWAMVPPTVTMGAYGAPLTNNDNLGFICGPNSTAGAYVWSCKNYGGPLSITVNSSIPVRDGVWRHLALVRNGVGTNNVTFYIDGVVIGQSSSNGTSTWSNTNMCCGVGGSPGAPDNQYCGYIANVRFSNIARYTAAFTSPTNYFTVDANTNFLFTAESTYAAWYDVSNNYVPMMQISPRNFSNPVTQTSNIKKFNSLNSIQSSSIIGADIGGIGAPPGVTLNNTTFDTLYTMPGQFTWECWVYVPSGLTQNTQPTIWQSQSLGIASSTSFDANKFFINISGYGQVSTVISNDGAWHHIAVVRATLAGENNCRVYIDGVDMNHVHPNISTPFIFSGSPSFQFFMTGSAANSKNFNGNTDELRITKGVARYTSNFTPPTAPYPTN